MGYLISDSAFALLLQEDLLHPTHFAGLKAHLGPMGMGRRPRQDVLHHTSSELPGSLMLLLYDLHRTFQSDRLYLPQYVPLLTPGDFA